VEWKATIKAKVDSLVVGMAKVESLVEFMAKIKAMLSSRQHQELPPRNGSMNLVLATPTSITQAPALKELSNIFVLALATLSSPPPPARQIVPLTLPLDHHYFRFLVIKSQTTNLTLGSSFGHNLYSKNPNDHARSFLKFKF
jgi:hypothetical protein